MLAGENTCADSKNSYIIKKVLDCIVLFFKPYYMIKKLTLYFLFSYILLIPIFSKILLDFKLKKHLTVQTINNSLFNKWLRENVSTSGYVNYKKGQQQVIIIKDYISYLLSINANLIKNKNERLAYYINLYNALVVYGVLKHYPTKGVFKIPNVSFFKLSFYLKSKLITIDQLEKKIIFPQFKNPLVHFALNCGAYSCPILLNKAYNRANVKTLLYSNTRFYLKNKKFNKLDKSKKILYLSKIFSWYAKDFGNLKAFYKKYTGVKLDLSGYTISYLPYSWALNGN